jgi:hypothetical protein
MKTKTVRKEFWVKEGTFRDIKKINTWINSDILVNSEPDSGNDFMNPIIIEFEVPEKQVTITESDFENAWDESLGNHSDRCRVRFSNEFYNFKKKLFGECK